MLQVRYTRHKQHQRGVAKKWLFVFVIIYIMFTILFLLNKLLLLLLGSYVYINIGTRRARYNLRAFASKGSPANIILLLLLYFLMYFYVCVNTTEHELDFNNIILFCYNPPLVITTRRLTILDIWANKSLRETLCPARLLLHCAAPILRRFRI